MIYFQFFKFKKNNFEILLKESRKFQEHLLNEYPSPPPKKFKKSEFSKKKCFQSSKNISNTYLVLNKKKLPKFLKNVLKRISKKKFFQN